MSEKSAKLKVKDLTESITKEHLSVVLGNKRRKGGGPIDNIELIKDGETYSAIVTFKEAEAVDIILDRGDTVVINDITARVKRFFDSSRRKSCVTPHISASKNFKAVNSEQVESNDDLSGSKSTPEKSKKKTKRNNSKASSHISETEQVSDLDNVSESEPLPGKSKNKTAQKSTMKGKKSVANKRKESKASSHTSDSEQVSDLDESESESLPQKFKNKTVKSTVKNKKSVGNKRKESKASSHTSDSEQVSDLDESENESLPQKSKNKTVKSTVKNKKSVGNKRKESKASSDTSDSEQVSDLDDTSENEQESTKYKSLKPHKEAVREKNKCAIKKKYSLSEEETKPHRKKSADISQFIDDEEVKVFDNGLPEKSKNRMQKSIKKSTIMKEQSCTNKTSVQNKARSQRKEIKTNVQASDDEEDSDYNDSSGSGSNSFPVETKYATKKHLKGPTVVKKSSLTNRTSSNSSEDSDLEGPWETTVKAKVKDLSKSKEFYIYYFEDCSISQGPFNEETLLLDGLNRNLYVTFYTKKAALATVRFKHKSDQSNFLEVKMATEEDFDTYNNLLAVYGYFCENKLQKKELMALVAKKTQMDVVDIIQHEELRSAIIVFSPESCEDISSATWASLNYNKIWLILAPVFKTNCVKVTGINPLCADPTLQRYMANRNRSGGGSLKFFQRQSETEALVILEKREDFDGILAKSQHMLEGYELHINLYHQCLSPEVYKKQILLKNHLVAETYIEHHLDNTKDQASLLWKTPSAILKCKVNQLYTSTNFDSSKNTSYTFQLCKFGSTFLTRYSKDLQKVVQTEHCKYILSTNEEHGCLILKIDWPQKITLKQVKEMLHSGFTALSKYLNRFTVAQFNIDSSYIHEFQKCCQVECQKEKPIIEVFFDHVDNFAVFITNRDKKQIEKLVNDMHHNFMSSVSKSYNTEMTTPPSESEGTPKPRSSDNVKQHLARKEKCGTNKGKVPVIEQKQPNIEQELELEEKDIILFKKTNFHKNIEKECEPLEIVFSSDNKHAVIRGNDKNNIDRAQIALLKKGRDFVSNSIRGMFTEEQLQLLNREDVQNSINKLFEEKNYHAHFRCSANLVHLFFVRGDNDTALKGIINSHVTVKEKRLDNDLAFILKSEKGQKFLSDLCESTDGVKMSCCVKLQENCLLLIASSQHIDAVMNEVDRFAEENRPYEKKIPFSNGKQLFVKKFLGSSISQIEDSLIPLGAKLIKNTEGFTVQGLKDGVNLGETKLSNLSGKILVEDITLQYFGIKEFLQRVEGKSFLTSVENNHSCIIVSANESQEPKRTAKDFQSIQTQPTKLPNLIAHAKVGECSFFFMQGDITGLEVDAIVNPLDSSLKFQSGLGKALISRGGLHISSQLASFSMQGIPGEVKVTSAGNLDKCKNIIHVVCPVFTGTEVNELEGAINGYLKHTIVLGVKSLAMPAIGVGNIFKFLPVVACKLLMRSLQQHLANTNSSLTKICFCDFKSDHVKELIERFKNIFAVSVDEDGELQETSSKALPSQPSNPVQVKPAKAPKQFRNIKVNLVTGEITKQKTDVIVVTVGKSLNLSKSGMTKDIVTYGGDAVQQELTDNYGDEIKQGEFGTTSGGNLYCKNIYYARLHRWMGNSEEHLLVALDISQKLIHHIQHCITLVKYKDHTNSLNKLVYKILQNADQQKVTSISIPAMGTGSSKYPPDAAAKAITEAISQFDMDKPNSSLKLLNLVVYKQDINVKQAFEAVLSTGGSHKTDAGASSFLGSGGSKHKTQFKSVNLTIKRGDITAEKCDAIISGIRDSLDMSNSGAVCKALLLKCGSSLQDECNNKKDEMAQKGFIATSAPNLNCQFIYHVSMDKFSRKWDRCISQVLEDAENQNLTSIAMPALGTGSRHADYQQIKQAIFSGVDYFSNRSKGSLKDVRLVVFGQEMLDMFLSEDDRHKNASSFAHEADVSTLSLKKISDHVNLKVYAESHQTIVNVKKEINHIFKGAFKEMKEKDVEIKRLNKHQVQQLEAEGMKYCVRVSVNVEEGLITMKSFITEGFVHVIKLSKTFVVAAVKDHHKSLQQAVVAAIQWQFEQQGKWRNFEPILNSELEKEFKSKSKHHDITDSRNRTYRVDFSSMKEFQVDESGHKSGQSINVRRHDLTKEGEALPKKWENMGSSENLKLVTLQAGSPEYKSAEQQFIKGGANQTIKKIQRIQNKSLYQQYKAKKREMDSRNSKGDNNEQKLFHGTDSTTVPAINENGFNRSFCGKNATAYGNGVYFAVNSSYSVGYAPQSPQGERFMYIARVLTGESIQSRQGMTHLPNKPGMNIPYDSGSASGIYIIFHDSQAYPEYLITF